MILGHCRTRIFAFPKADLDAGAHMQPAVIAERSEAKATLVSDLRDFFQHDSAFRHYATDCSLRASVDEVVEKQGKRRDGSRFPLFLVLEWDTSCETVMDEGTCFIVDEGKVVGGRVGEEATMAWRAAGAPWPEVDDDSDFTNTILAAVKIVQDETETIREVAEVSCFYDSNGQAVYPVSMTMSANVSVSSPLSVLDVDAKVGRCRKLIDAFETNRKDDKRVGVLVDSLRLEQINNDDYRRGWYLCLFEAIEAVLSRGHKQEFHQRHRTYRKTIGHPKPGTKMDMKEFARLQRDALAEVRRIYLDE